jgi:hypothetical protein
MPTDRKDQYRDQKGKRGTRARTGGSTEELEWEGGKKILLAFAGSPGSAPPAVPRAICCSRASRGIDEASDERRALP